MLFQRVLPHGGDSSPTQYLRCALRQAFDTKACTYSYPNLVILIGAEGVSHAACIHQSVLAAHSPFLREIFKEDGAEKSSITMGHYTTKILKMVVELLYTGQTTFDDMFEISLVINAMKEMGIACDENAFWVCGILQTTFRQEVVNAPAEEDSIEGPYIVPEDEVNQLPRDGTQWHIDETPTRKENIPFDDTMPATQEFSLVDNGIRYKCIVEIDDKNPYKVRKSMAPCDEAQDEIHDEDERMEDQQEQVESLSETAFSEADVNVALENSFENNNEHNGNEHDDDLMSEPPRKKMLLQDQEADSLEVEVYHQEDFVRLFESGMVDRASLRVIKVEPEPTASSQITPIPSPPIPVQRAVSAADDDDELSRPTSTPNTPTRVSTTIIALKSTIDDDVEGNDDMPQLSPAVPPEHDDDAGGGESENQGNNNTTEEDEDRFDANEIHKMVDKFHPRSQPVRQGKPVGMRKLFAPKKALPEVPPPPLPPPPNGFPPLSPPPTAQKSSRALRSKAASSKNVQNPKKPTR